MVHTPVAFAPCNGFFTLNPENEDEIALDNETSLVDTWKAMVALPKSKVRITQRYNF